MIQVNTIVFVLLLHLLAILVIGVAVWTVIALRGRSRDRNALRTLIKKIKEDSERRKGETRTFLEKTYGLEGDELKKTARDIHERERLFCQGFVNLYLKRDAGAASQMYISVEEMLRPYRNLQPIKITVEKAAELDEKAEIKRLQGENQRLTEELGITMDTMSRMLQEYSAMFGGNDSAPDKGKILSMFSSEENTNTN